MRLFYDHLLIPLHGIYAHIEHLEIDAKDKRELIQIIDSTTHHTILDVILKHLHHDHHQTFLEKIHRSPHDPQHLNWLKTHIPAIENKISQRVKQLRAELLELIS